MLFNSYPFLLGFFPLTFVAFFLLARFDHRVAAGWLGLASLFFYAYWSIAALPLLVISICINYWFGLYVTPAASAEAVATASLSSRRRRLYVAVALNLGILAYFKYANFFIDNLNLALAAASAAQVRALHVVLPIGISFFTFTQIAFLVDCYEGKVRERNFIHYLLFVSYFPHLISGPVLHHSQMMPQFRQPDTYRIQAHNILLGLLNVAVGLAKKVLLADEFSQYASPVFDAARDGQHLGFIVAWTGALAYTLQIYFDFSGYSDMAIGLSRMLGIELPLNFNAPYKAANIIDFWRRWHMSLSQFLRDYLYFRLGGNRRGTARRYVNLMATMLLGGLWHGASWTFVAWGGLHGSLSSDQSRVAGAGAAAAATRSAARRAGKIRGRRPHLPRGGRGLGLLPLLHLRRCGPRPAEHGAHRRCALPRQLLRRGVPRHCDSSDLLRLSRCLLPGGVRHRLAAADEPGDHPADARHGRQCGVDPRRRAAVLRLASGDHQRFASKLGIHLFQLLT